MTQLVHEPTRGDYLLDLMLSNFSGVKTEVLPDDCRPQAYHGYAQALCALTCRGWSKGSEVWAG